MAKINDAIKRQCKDAYEKGCNAYLVALLNAWELEAYYGYWNSDKVGTIYHYGETHNLSMTDIVYIVDNNIEESEVIEWEDYLLDAHEFGFTLPNLESWHMGCPRVPRETFERFRKMKSELKELVENEKRNLKTNEF